LATVAKTLAQIGSMASTPPRSQMMVDGPSAMSLNSVRCSWGAVVTVISPIKVTMRQPSLVECVICIPRHLACGQTA
jgi:hypothetical protein